MKHIKYLALPVVAVGLALSACAPTETPAKVKDESAPSASNSVVVEEADASEEPEAPEIATLGDTMILGDWEVKVTEVAKNADDAVHQANMFNDKPKGVYVLVTYKATYTGTERSADIESDLSWSLTASDNQIHDQAYQVTPADNGEWPTMARKGGTVKGQVLFDIKPKLLKGGILTVETYDADFNEIYADFGL